MTERNAPILKYRKASILLEQAGATRTLVQDLDLEVREREIVALVGESGSGKTLTALSVLGLLAPNLRLRAETAELRGRDLTRCTPRDWRALRGTDAAMVFQEPLSALNPVLTIGEQIVEILKYKTDVPRKARREVAAQLLRDVDIARVPHILDEYPHQLSGGMRQRVMLAMAMAARPALLIADEPTTALDNTVQRQVLALIARTAERAGIGVLFVTHDLSVVAQLADRVAVMQRGRLVETGSVETVFEAPSHPYTRRLMALAPRRPEAPVPVQAPTPVVAASEPTVPLLRLENIVKRYAARGESFAAVDDVTLELHAGRTLGLVGESGSGKSTLARIVAGLLRPDAGRVRVDGIDVTAAGQETPGQGGKVQMVFQDPQASLNPRMRVGAIVAEPMLARGLVTRAQAPDEVARLLEAVGLPLDVARRWPHELSGGQRQRIGIARALGARPRLLVCDEPVSALDASVQAQILDLLKRLQPEYGLAYLFIAHGLDSVYALSDEVAVMSRGQVVEHGTRDQVFHAPRHDYTRTLLDAMLDADPRASLFRQRPRQAA
ncbi:ABC transporter ATP-binding protein [Bordetella sp. N]|uniref:dipeptide ABC transporter ATP-binding protein n=1 Tax=Bordetella sp. N TaxID=1746199 RepID=UPI00070F986A|nr:ABC transporter ATP-binding protein [Bordetella sp. N]ALM81648.1 ABC transporter [Bordetella sp. N]